MIDRRPALIAYCANRQDVIEAVNFARTTGILTAVRSGGHNIAGASLCDGGLDAATQAHGLATTTGVNSDTGLIGLTLGGGIGRLGR